MLIVLQDAAQQQSFIGTTARTPSIATRDIQWLVLHGDLAPTLAQLRESQPDRAIGFIATDEPSAIDALIAGADEAAVIEADNAVQLVAFLDRTDLRARQRGETRGLRSAFAHAEKLAALGTLVAGVGHEINNPLSAVLLSIAATQRYVLPLLDTRSQVDVSSVLDDMNSAANSIASIVRDLRLFARADEQEAPDLVDVPEQIDHVLRLLGRDVSNHGVVTRDYAPNLPQLLIPRSRFTQVLTNLLINASHAIADIERPVHQVQISVRTDDDFLAVVIRDTGSGISSDALDRIFDPFYTTKRKELGTGLGLSISRTILRNLGGDLIVESVFGEGATFICFLPLPTHEALVQAQASIPPMIGLPSATKQTVLLVDDDPQMLRAYARLLNVDHHVLVARDANEAIELLEADAAPGVLVLEIGLPARDGIRLMTWIQRERPKLARNTVIVTAMDGDARHADMLAAHDGPVLYKPVRADALIAAIAAFRP